MSEMDLAQCLVIGISSRALFDLEDENKVYESQGVERYREYQLAREDECLKPGTAFHLVEALLRLNERSPRRLVEVIVMSRNTPDTGLRILNSIKKFGLDISRAAFAGGGSQTPYLEAFDVDLFLSKSETDVQAAIDSGFPAALIYDPPEGFDPTQREIRIAFDADAVVFSDDSEQIYREQGLAAFASHEAQNAHVTMSEGPMAKLLKTLAFIQRQQSEEGQKVRIAIITARGSPAHERVIRSLRDWDVRVDEAFFLGGLKKKGDILKAFGAHIFFDDQDVHLLSARKVVPSARVPYRSNSPLNKTRISSR
jgi:5'-nucleotidase